jgi:hypothetical protein
MHTLFNDAISKSDYMASNDWMTVKNKLGRLWQGRGLILGVIPVLSWKE